MFSSWRAPNAMPGSTGPHASRHRWQPSSASIPTMHIALEAAVREHLQELGEMRPRVD